MSVDISPSELTNDPCLSIMIALRDVTLAALTPVPQRVVLSPGLDVVWDDCCAGLLWVRLTRVFPTGFPFPNVDINQAGGVRMWAGQFGVGISRCAQGTVGDSGASPSPETITSDTIQELADRAAMGHALLVDYPAMSDFTAECPLRFVQWDAQGPEGGCVGGEWQVIVSIPVC